MRDERKYEKLYEILGNSGAVGWWGGGGGTLVTQCWGSTRHFFIL